MTTFHEIRRQLKLYRAEHTLSQAGIGDMIGADQGSISAFERGEGNLGADKIDKLMQIMGLRLIQDGPGVSTALPSSLREKQTDYGPRREVPIPSAEQIELALDAARRLEDTETTRALQEMQLQILGIIEELGGVGEAFTNHLKTLEQGGRGSRHQPKNAVGE